LLEVMSLEMLVESVGTVAGVQSWRERVANFMRWWSSLRLLDKMEDKTSKWVVMSSVAVISVRWQSLWWGNINGSI